MRLVLILLITLINFAPLAHAESMEELKLVYDKGIEHLSRGEFDAAKEYFTHAIELNPNFGAAYHGLAISFYQLGYLDLALTNFERAIARNYVDHRTHYVMAVAYTRTEQYREALESYKKAIEVDPEFPHAYHNLGLLYYRTHNWEKSRENLEKALSMQPDDTRVMFSLGLTYIKLERSEKVIDMITQLRTLRDETKAAKLEDVMRPPPDAPLYSREPDPILFEPVLPSPARPGGYSGTSSSPGNISITGRINVKMQGVSPEPEQ